MPNIYDPVFDIEQDNEPYIWQRALLGRAAGSERLGASLFAFRPVARRSRSTLIFTTRNC